MKNQIIFALTSKKCQIVIIFLFASGLRAIPELLSGKYPVGFDTIQGYIPSIVALPDNAPMQLFGWAYSPLTIYFLGTLYFLTKIDPYLLMKIMGPVFYGLFIASFYYMLNKGLGWNNKMSFFVATLFLLEPAVLRTGWDQLREELALSLFFIMLAKTKFNLLKTDRTNAILVFTLSILIVFSHQLVPVLLFVIVIWQMLKNRLKKENTSLRAVVIFVPAAAIFGWQLYSQFINPSWNPNFSPLELSRGAGNFIFADYFKSDPRFLDGNYLSMLLHLGSLSFLTIIPLIPFALKGFFKHKALTPILAWLLLASFSIAIYPTYALAQYWWWMLLLPIPLTIYTGNFLDKVKVFDNIKRLKIATATLALLAIITIGYASSTLIIGNQYSFTYIPSGLVESSIPIDDIPDATKALIWANENIAPNSTLIVPEKLQGIAYMQIKSNIKILIAQPTLSLETVLRNAAHLNSKNIYSIYYASETGNEISLKVLASFGRLGIYQILN